MFKFFSIRQYKNRRMKYLNQTKKKEFPRRIKTTLRNKAKLPFGDETKNIRVVRKTKLI